MLFAAGSFSLSFKMEPQSYFLARFLRGFKFCKLSAVTNLLMAEASSRCFAVLEKRPDSAFISENRIVISTS